MCSEQARGLTSLVHIQLGCALRCIAGLQSRAHVRAAPRGRRVEPVPRPCLRRAAEPVPCPLRSAGSRFGKCPFPHLQTGRNHDPPSLRNPGPRPPQGPTTVLRHTHTHTLFKHFLSHSHTLSHNKHSPQVSRTATNCSPVMSPNKHPRL